MRKYSILSALFILPAITSKAQVMAYRVPFADIGIKVGGNFERISSAPLKSGTGFVTGFYIRKQIEQIGVRLEVTGSTATYTTKYPASFYMHTSGVDTAIAAKFQVIYVNVPLLFEYSPINKLNLLLGPQFGYVASATDKNKIYNKVYGNDKFLAGTDVSIVVGVEYDIRKKIKLGARVVKGVTDVNNSTYYLVHKTWTSTGAQISISYRLF